MPRSRHNRNNTRSIISSTWYAWIQNGIGSWPDPPSACYPNVNKRCSGSGLVHETKLDPFSCPTCTLALNNVNYHIHSAIHMYTNVYITPTIQDHTLYMYVVIIMHVHISSTRMLQELLDIISEEVGSVVSSVM